MVDIFNLWNFYQYPNGTCAFDVTEANMPGLKNGTAELMEACLLAFGITTRARSWRVIPFRSHFFTDYADSDDWKDRWQTGWTMRVLLPQPTEIARQNVFSVWPYSVDTLDDSWDYDEEEDAQHDRRALLITMLHGELKQAAQLAAELVAQVEADGDSRSTTETEIRSFSISLHQLRITIEGHIFPERLELLDKFLQFLRQRNGAVNWRALTGEYDE
jgi:hypothetical protein